MNKKIEFLSRGYRIDVMINAKLEQVGSLRSLITKMNTELTDMPKDPNRNGSRVEDTVVKIVSLENEINDDVERLIAVKRDIMRVIDGVDDRKEHIVLTLRYLNFRTWEEIASELCCTVRNVHLIHGRALENVRI